MAKVVLSTEQWVPIGVSEMEPAAEAVVRSTSNHLVVAGPGAGKTELLAQRADYLLRTGTCPAPQRILAISFKRDAAKNIEARVNARTPDWADRFDSFTLDSLAKRIVDRFSPSLPPTWRPDSHYQVRTATVSASYARQWLAGASVPEGLVRPNVSNWEAEKLRRCFDLVMHGSTLPLDEPHLHPVLRAWSIAWWKEQLSLLPGQPSLTFPMLNRLAAFLLRCNPKIAAAMRQTYAYVFLDEFQDTTASQWDLVHSVFANSQSVLTAVGDSKQRIMVWAGAKADIFDVYQTGFASMRVELVRNYRSVPKLVRMQHIIAAAVEADTVHAQPASKDESAGVCAILEFRTSEREATSIADLIKKEIDSGQARPRDYCVLVRQRTGDMITRLQEQLKMRGITLRDESSLQDLLAEPLTHVVVSAVRLGTRERDAEAWSDLTDALVPLLGLDEEQDGAEIEHIASVHKECVRQAVEAGDAKELPRRIINIVSEERWRSTYRQYVNGDYLDKVAGDLGEVLQTSLTSTGDPAQMVDDLLGANVVPAMTIHKSKGLEFQTVIFLGLEDGQWWSFRSQPDEEKRAFFVAFSRAIRRVLFTFSDERDTKWGRRHQRRDDVDALHQILKSAGVQTINQRT